jgi:hypothetical protein
MAQTSYPFDGIETTETQYTQFFKELQDTGVIGDGSALSCSADGTTLKVKVQPGLAIVRGHVYESTSVEEIELPPGTSQPRIDTIVLRLDPNTDSILLNYIKGEPAATPVSPPRTKTDAGIYELPLADVRISSNGILIQPTDVTDVRRRTGSLIGDWTTATQPGSGERRMGKIGYNRDKKTFEFWDGTAWKNLVDWTTIAGRPTTSTNDGRNITVSTAAPAAAQGSNGDIWLQVI